MITSHPGSTAKIGGLVGLGVIDFVGGKRVRDGYGARAHCRIGVSDVAALPRA